MNECARFEDDLMMPNAQPSVLHPCSKINRQPSVLGNVKSMDGTTLHHLLKRGVKAQGERPNFSKKHHSQHCLQSRGGWHTMSNTKHLTSRSPRTAEVSKKEISLRASAGMFFDVLVRLQRLVRRTVMIKSSRIKLSAWKLRSMRKTSQGEEALVLRKKQHDDLFVMHLFIY